MVNDSDVARLEDDFFRRGDELGGEHTDELADTQAQPSRGPAASAPPPSSPGLLFPRPAGSTPPARFVPVTRTRRSVARAGTAGQRLFVIGTVLLFVFTLAGALVLGTGEDDAGRVLVAARNAAATAVPIAHLADPEIGSESNAGGGRAAVTRSKRVKPKRAVKRARRNQRGRRRSTDHRRPTSGKLGTEPR